MAPTAPPPKTAMKSSLTLTLFLLILMALGGVAGAVMGGALGRDALKGVTQPDFGLSSRSGPRNAKDQEPAPGQPVAFLTEPEILKNVKTRMADKKGSKPTPVTPTPAPIASSDSTPNPTQSKPPAQAGFPVVSQDQGVLIEVTSARSEGNSVILDVNLRNQGTKPVRFLYSFLNVTDSRGKAVVATTEGLPGELQPLSESFSGTISIPKALLDGVTSLSLSLTDYPDQKIQLKLANIPLIQAPAQ
jgi:hypothetical protein